MISTTKTKAMLVATAVAVLMTLIVYIQLNYANLYIEDFDVYKSSRSRAIISRSFDSGNQRRYSMNTQTQSTPVSIAASIQRVYPLPQYGSDLCLLYDRKKDYYEQKEFYFHPNTVHYVKISDKETDTELKLLDYTSIFSVDRFYKPDKIVIHSNRNVTGTFWELANNLQTRIELRYLERQATVGKLHYKTPLAITHEADMHKLDIALNEGGIVMDFDVIILNGANLRRQQAISECVLGIERECTFVNSGFLSCVPNSTFVRLWRESYEEDYRNTWSNYLYNSGEYPASVLRLCPSCYNVYLDPEIAMNPDAGAPGGPGPGRQPWIQLDKVNWRNKTVVHLLLHHLQVPKTNYLFNLWDCPYKDIVKFILGGNYEQFLPKRIPNPRVY